MSGSGSASLVARRNVERIRRDPAFISKRVRVSGVGAEVDSNSIREVFEEGVGAILECTLREGVAFITFDKPADAVQAVLGFDEGELNGRKIEVVMA